MKKVQIPQFLGYQVRVHGLTARQYSILLIGGVVSGSCWQSFSTAQRPLAIASVAALVATMLVVVFVRISGRAVEEWVLVILIWAIQPEKLRGKAFQRAFERVQAVGEDGMVELNGGRYLAIVEVKGHYLAQLEERFAEAFAEFLGGLSFPISLRISMRLLELNQTIHPSLDLPKDLRRLQAHYLSFLHNTLQTHPSREVTCALVLSAGKRAQCVDYRDTVIAALGRATLPCRVLSSEEEILSFYQESFGGQEETIAARFQAQEMRFETISGDHHYGTGLVVSRLPGSLSIGWLARFIQQEEEPYDLRLSYHPVDNQQITNQLERKAVQLGAALQVAGQKRNGVSRQVTRHALKEIEAIQERLILRQSQVVSTTLVLCLVSSSRKQLQARRKSMRLKLRSQGITATPLYFQHHLAFLSAVYGSSLLPSYAHLLPTEAAASFFPFIQIPHIGSNGVLLGAIHQGGDLVSIDLDDQLNNNLAVLGAPGSGKSVFFKTLCSRLATAYRNLSITVIDIEGEYVRWAEAVGAHQTLFSADSLGMNPFLLRQGRSLREKLTFFVGLVALLVGEQGELTQHEKSLVVEAVLKSYRECGITDDPATYCNPVPFMEDFVRNLREKEASHDLAYRLEMYRYLFPASRKVDEIKNARYQVYNLHDLPSELRSIAMYLIVDQLSTLLYEENKEGRKHLVIIDEAWFLSKFTLGANFLNEFARRARKYGTGLWVGTQQVQDLLTQQEGNFKGLLDLCETKMLFRQEINNLGAILKLEPSEEAFLRSAGRGEALYITSQERFELNFLASERELTFARGANNQ